MAIIQGMCRNCGSLIMFDDRDDKCECVFCHCVFPSAEAVEIMNNPEGRTFANEVFEAPADGSKHNATRVFSTESLEKRIEREELKKANEPESRKRNEFEVSASDVKAPKKLVIGLVAGTVLAAGIVFGISYPMYKTRTALKSEIEQSIVSVFDRIIDVDTTSDEEGRYYNGFSVYGQTCQYMDVITLDSISEDDATAIFDNYCALRAQKLSGSTGDIYDGVKVKIYCDGGYYVVTGQDGTVNALFTEDAEPTTEE